MPSIDLTSVFLPRRVTNNGNQRMKATIDSQPVLYKHANAWIKNEVNKLLHAINKKQAAKQQKVSKRFKIDTLYTNMSIMSGEICN